MNAGLREASANLMVGNDNERLETLRRLAVTDATAFDTKQADCSSACETIAAEVSEIEDERSRSEAEVERLRAVEAEARGRRIDESATFCQALRELISSEMEKEKTFRELVGTTAGLVDGQYELQSSLVAPQRQLERAQREIIRYRDAYGAAAAGVRALEDATALVLERTEPVLAEHQQRAEAWRTQVLRDHVAIWQAASRLLEKQLQHEQGRQAELVEENAQLERQALRALRAGNKGCATTLLSFLFWSPHGSTRGQANQGCAREEEGAGRRVAGDTIAAVCARGEEGRDALPRDCADCAGPWAAAPGHRGEGRRPGRSAAAPGCRFFAGEPFARDLRGAFWRWQRAARPADCARGSRPAPARARDVVLAQLVRGDARVGALALVRHFGAVACRRNRRVGEAARRRAAAAAAGGTNERVMHFRGSWLHCEREEFCNDPAFHRQN